MERQDFLAKAPDRYAEFPKWGFGRWKHIYKNLMEMPPPVVLWCPSHGTKPNWKPNTSDYGNAEQIRALNAAADKEAGKQSSKQWKRYRHQEHDHHVKGAERFAKRTLDRLHHRVLTYILQGPALVEDQAVWLEHKLP